MLEFFEIYKIMQKWKTKLLKYEPVIYLKTFYVVLSSFIKYEIFMNKCKYAQAQSLCYFEFK